MTSFIVSYCMPGSKAIVVMVTIARGVVVTSTLSCTVSPGTLGEGVWSCRAGLAVVVATCSLGMTSRVSILLSISTSDVVSV